MTGTPPLDESTGNSRAAITGRDTWAVDGFAPLPGDLVSLPEGDRAGNRVTVETVYLCAEPNGGPDDASATRWTWIVLSDGRLLEVAPRGCALYQPPRLLPKGTGAYLELVAQDGALVRFEERVRAGTWEARPVRLPLEGRRWRITSTGTVTARRLGPATSGPWGQLRAGLTPPNGVPAAGPYDGATARPGGGESLTRLPDVYFTCVATNDANSLAVGLWATDVCLAFGRRLGATPSAAGLRIVPDAAS